MGYLHRAYFNTTTKIDLLNVNHDLKRALRESGMKDGLLTALTPLDSQGLVLLENDPQIQKAFLEMICSFTDEPEALATRRRSDSGALASHLRAALLQKSISIPVSDGKLMCGHWQELILIDFDQRAKRAEVYISAISGEAASK